MSNPARSRAKEHFPAVLLTLLSIVQAIALELLWGHLVESSFLYELTAQAILGWAQVLATLLAMILIWVVYASNVMRFSWVPVVSDSTYPFVIGIVEFWLVESLAPGSHGLWLVVMGFVFVAMTWIAQITMRRARFDVDNSDFFKDVPQATWKDFTPQAIAFSIFLGAGISASTFNLSFLVMFIAVVATLAFLSWQFVNTARYWNLAMASR